MTVKTRVISSAVSLALLCQTPLTINGAANNILLDRREGDFHDIVVVDSASMNTFGIQRLANELTSKDAPIRVLVLSIFENKEDAFQTMAGKGHTDTEFGEAVERLRSARSRGPFQMIRLISIDGNTVVQAVNGPTVSRTVVHGTDPASFTVGGKRCELLEIYFVRPPRAIRPDGSNPPIAKAYLRVDVLPNLEEADAITRAVQEKLHHRNVTVSIRTDSWFLEDSEFPLWYPFEVNPKPPSFEEYNSRGEVVCVANVTNDGTRCRHFPPS